MLSIGALYGRLIGECLVLWFGEYYYYGDKYDDKNALHSWMDPGAIALIGAASFFAGVSRLTISLTVIMIEITNDVTMLLPVMTGNRFLYSIIFFNWRVNLSFFSNFIHFFFG